LNPKTRLVLSATPIKLCRIPFYAAWLAICPGFPEGSRAPMRHKTGYLLQPFQIVQQLIVGTVSSWLALRRVHFGEDGLL